MIENQLVTKYNLNRTAIFALAFLSFSRNPFYYVFAIF
jgi:hypothetical protein